VIAPQNYLNQPETVIAQVLTGKYADGLGGVKKTCRTARLRPGALAVDGDLDVTPDEALGYVKGEVNYKGHREKVFSASPTRKNT